MSHKVVILYIYICIYEGKVHGIDSSYKHRCAIRSNSKFLNFKKLLGFVACTNSKTLRNRSMF